MKKIIAATALMVLSNGAFADIVYSVNGHQEILLKKVSNKRFEKISVTSTGVEKIQRIRGNSVTTLSEKELNIADDSAHYALEATGKNIVKIEDEKELVNTEVEADIKTSLLGRVKEITISGKTIDSVYADSYKRTGIDVLKGLNLGGAVKSNITTSDLKCIADGDLLKCEQDQELKFTVVGF